MNNEAFERAKSAYGTGAYDDATMEFIFPQLAESEDERIRKEIIEVLRFVPSSMWEQAKTNYERCFAYLEKQKEQNKCPEFCSGHCVGCERNEQKDYRKLYEDIAKSEWFKQNYIGKSLGCDEEQKPAQTDDEKEYIRTLKNLISGFIRDRQPEDVVYYQRVYDWLDGRHIEQKPEVKDPFDDEQFRRGYEAGKHDQQPAEWDEEDEEKLERVDDLLWMLDDYIGDDCSICEERSTRLREEIKNELCPFLKSLRPSWKPSEEQMKALWDAYKGGEEQEPLRELIEHLRKL